jgi:CHAT domain-containing protein
VNRVRGIDFSNWDRAHEDFSAAYDVWKKLYVTNPAVENSVVEEAINVGAAKMEIGRHANDAKLIQSAIEILEPVYENVWQKNSEWIYSASIELAIAYAYIIHGSPSRHDIFDKAMALLDRLEGCIRKQPTSSDQTAFALARTFELRGSIMIESIRSSDNSNVNVLNRAVQTIAQATESFRKLGLAYRTVVSRIRLADVVYRVGDPAIAESLCSAAVSDARERASKAVSKSSLANMYQPVYAACQLLALFQSQRDALLESILTLESALEPTLQKKAHVGEMHRTLGQADKDRLSELLKQYEVLTARMESRTGAVSEETEIAISQISELDAAITQIIGAFEQGPLVPSINTIARSIPENGALIVPLLLGGAWICLDNETNQKPGVTKVACHDFEDAVGKLATKLPFLDRLIEDFLDQANGIVTKAAPDPTNALESFGSLIVRPLSDHLSSLGIKRGSPLVIVSHGRLNLIPIHAATWTGATQKELFGSMYDLMVCPSITWLTTTSSNRNSKEEKQTRVIVVADSKGNLEGSRLLGQLIAQRVGSHDSVLLSQGEATKTAVLNALPTATHLHIAGHSTFDIEMPFHSAVELADDDLTVADFASQVAAAPVVVILSSCSSGMGSVFHRSSEYWGFPFALHSWGVSTVISNLWPTLDIVMLLFFSEYYRTNEAIRRPVIAFKMAQSYLREIDAEGARSRLYEICREHPQELASLQTQLNYIVSSYGESAPFSNPILWAATFCSGVSDTPRVQQL